MGIRGWGLAIADWQVPIADWQFPIVGNIDRQSALESGNRQSRTPNPQPLSRQATQLSLELALIYAMLEYFDMVDEHHGNVIAV